MRLQVRFENGRFMTRSPSMALLMVPTNMLTFATRLDHAFGARFVVIRLARTAIVFAMRSTLPADRRLVVPAAIAVAPSCFAVPVGLALVLPTALRPIIVRFAPAAIRIGISLAFRFIRAAAVLPSFFRPVTEICRPFVVLISRPDDAVQPFTDRHTGATRSLARGLPRFRMETSKIPRSARLHSRVQAAS